MNKQYKTKNRYTGKHIQISCRYTDRKNIDYAAFSSMKNLRFNSCRVISTPNFLQAICIFWQCFAGTSPSRPFQFVTASGVSNPHTSATPDRVSVSIALSSPVIAKHLFVIYANLVFVAMFVNNKQNICHE